MSNVLLRPWRRAIRFKGRATRTEYWLFLAQLGIVYVAWAFVLSGLSTYYDSQMVDFALGWATLLYILFMFVASLSAGARRLHDHDKTGWLYLISFVPLFGWIFFLIMMLTPGTRGENSYGYDPREGEIPPAHDMAHIFS